MLTFLVMNWKCLAYSNISLLEKNQMYLYISLFFLYIFVK